MSNIPTSKKLTFQELISLYKIEIPIIQRDYAQGRTGKEEIRSNFLNALLDAVSGKLLELDFVYGSVKNDVFQPLDGQQRLTTLFLLHWYIATTENKMDETRKNLLSKFTYETRSSSREFCNSLINEGIVWSKELSISEIIIDSSWFFLSWGKDPTIKSMLTMLDAIHQTFQGTNVVWDQLNNISFQYIELQNFGLSDDLYIKMNARGKRLTDFENFKAKFIQLINQNKWENNVDPIETFSHQIDTTWADLFWNYRNNDEYIFDESLLNFFRTMAVNNYALQQVTQKNTTSGDGNFENNVRNLRSRDANNRLIDIPISFNLYLKLGCFDENYFKTIKAVFNKLSDQNGLRKFLLDTNYINEKEIFNGAIKNELAYADLVVLFAFYQYLALEENVETEKLISWMRIVRNLVEGSRVYLFNNATEFANALRSINELLPHRSYIVKYFAEKENDSLSLSGFIREQVNEEILKSKLLSQSDEWGKVIIEIENHKYFKGQVGFLLHWCIINNEPNLDKFKEYAQKSKAIFDENGLVHFDEFLFERALLATGDYLLKKGPSHSFLIDDHRDISWKRLLRDNNEKREILKQLIDKISVASIAVDLQAIIDGFNDVEDWRYYFIHQPEIIKETGTNRLIRRNGACDILVLGSTTTSGYHSEYYSFSLYLRLKEKVQNLDMKYLYQRSIYYPKSFIIGFDDGKYECSCEKIEKTEEINNGEDIQYTQYIQYKIIYLNQPNVFSSQDLVMDYFYKQGILQGQ